MDKNQYVLALLFFSFCIQAQQKTIESALSSFENLTYQNITGDQGAYVLQLKQPLDHSDITKGFFEQKIYLTHRGFDRPTVIVTDGYSVNENRISELANLLNANQLIVEHRFFGESVPDSMDFEYLNLKQATGDLNKVRQRFASLYSNSWVSTGISKGGATTIFYRYFYPNDVDVSVPYVAPINTAFEEPRIYDFLDTVGTEECRTKIKDFQLRILKNREALLPLLQFYSMGAGVEYSYVPLEKAFEYAVMEYPFSFWQLGHDCKNIPDQTATIQEVAAYFISVSDLTFFGDNAIEYYSPHYYQSATEMGYYGYETAEFKAHLTELPFDHNPMALFFPFEMTDTFDGQLLKDVNRWLKTAGHKFIYIYGENDTWSASAVPPNENVDSEWFILKGKHHGNARMAAMTPAEKERLISTLEKWLNLKIAP